MKFKIKRLIFCIFLISLVVTITNTTLAAYSTIDSNYDYTQNSESNRLGTTYSLQNSISTTMQNRLFSSSTYASSSFDLRDVIDINVKDQKSVDSCWTYAATSAVETNMALKYGYSSIYSPRHMEYATSKTFLDGINPIGFNREVNDGGNPDIALAYLTNGSGLVLEEDMPFEESTSKINLSEIDIESVAQVKEYKNFASIDKKIVDGVTKYYKEDGTEYWSARELSEVLEYKQWRNFAKVIDRAKLACQNSGRMIDDDFAEVSKIVEAGATKKKVLDYELSRYACYLIVQNGDPRKEVIALGQTYFAIQTRRQEVADYFNQLDEDNKRLVIRGDIKQWNQMLLEVAHNSGVITNQEYAEFQNAGYMGLYGGLTVDDIHRKKKLKDKEKILDFMGSEELAANLFRITQTEAKLKRENVKNKEKANQTHYTVGTTVRKAIKDIGGTMPEDLPTPEKSIKQVEKEQLKRLKDKKTKLMLDE